MSIEISISYDHVRENADMIIEASGLLMEKVEDQFPDCLAGEPEKLVSNCGIEEVIIDYAFHDKYEGQDFKATGAIVYIPFGEKMVQASFMYLFFSTKERV